MCKVGHIHCSGVFRIEKIFRGCFTEIIFEVIIFEFFCSFGLHKNLFTNNYVTITTEEIPEWLPLCEK